jgi:hypothetical protein
MRQMTVALSTMPGRTNSAPSLGRQAQGANSFRCIPAIPGFANRLKQYAAPWRHQRFKREAKEDAIQHEERQPENYQQEENE